VELTVVDIVTLLGLVTSSFVATSLDNLVILVVLLGANAARRSAVLMGYVISSIAVICVCMLGVVAGSIIDAGLIGYLGLVPLFLGCRLLYGQLRKEEHEAVVVEETGLQSEPGLWFSAFAMMFSNSGDSIAVFLPLMAESDRSALTLIVSCYLVIALLWSGLAYFISGRRSLAVRIEQRGAWIVPWVMIAVGAYILFDTATDTLV